MKQAQKDQAGVDMNIIRYQCTSTLTIRQAFPPGDKKIYMSINCIQIMNNSTFPPSHRRSVSV